jgi:hypothetical protein
MVALRHHRGVTDDLDAALDRLYGLPAGEFTAARDALARELRGAKRRDEAAEVKGLRRPTAPAAAINQLAREEPALMDALLDAARGLREVQERLLEGEAGRDELRAAADAERRAVGALVAAAGGLPEAPSAAALEKVRATLHAAATDDAVRDAIARGRLDREAESSGAWGAFPLTVDVSASPSDAPSPRSDAARSKQARSAASDAARPKAAGSARSKRARSDAAPAQEETSSTPSAADRARERRAAKRAEELERVRATAAEADKDLADAERAAGDAHKELEAAAERAEEARAQVALAERAEDAARAAAQKSLRALKRAEAVAADAAEQVARLERDDG